MYGSPTQERVDLDGDGRSEILVTGHGIHEWVYLSILGRTGESWQEWFHLEHLGKYCGDMRATVTRTGRVVADFLFCSGGTGIFDVYWTQYWIQCEEGHCAVVWSAPLLGTHRDVNPYYGIGEDYAVAEIQQLDTETIRLTTRRFSIYLLPEEYFEYSTELSFDTTARRTVGPDTVEIFRWNGSTYQQEHREESAALTITQESNPLTQETLRVVSETLTIPFWQASDSFDSAGYKKALADFWGLPLPDQPEDPTWGPSHRSPDVATHNGTEGKLGEWIAGLVGANDRSLCRLTAQHRIDDSFSLAGRLEVPCTVNLTRLAWADITSDGNSELLLLTLPPDEESAIDGLQRLHIYTMGEEIVELATLDGTFNGPDGAGIRWMDIDGDGTIEILAGLSLVMGDESPVRRFQVYRWDAAACTFTAGEVWTDKW